MTRRSLRGAVALAFSFSSLGAVAIAQAPPGPPPMPPAPPTTVAAPKPVPGPPGVAASVNGQRITTGQVRQMVAPRLADIAKQLNQQATDMLINNTLVDQEAKRQHVTVTAADINARLAEVRQQLAQRGMTLEAALAQSHENLATFRESQRIWVEAEKLIAKHMPSVNAVHARHILVLTNNPRNDPSVKPHTDADALKIIQKAQDELKSGKSWDDVCKRYSEDTATKDRGGDLGIIATGQPYDPAFLNAALALKKGQITPTPVKSIYGYHLIKADSTYADPTPANKAQLTAAVTQTRQQLMQQSLPAYLQSLRQKAKVVIYAQP